MAQGVASIFTNLAHLLDCSFFGIKSDNDITFEGFCPFRGNIDDPRYAESHCVFDNIESKKLTFLGLKRCLIGRATSRNADETGSFDHDLCGCAFRSPRRESTASGRWARLGTISRSTCIAGASRVRRLSASRTISSLRDLFSINNNENHWIELVTVKSDLADFDKRISDSSLNQRRVSQIGKVNWIQTEYPNAKWRRREYGRFQIEVNGNTDLDHYPNGDATMQAYGFPLTEDRTVTLRHDSVSIGAQYSFHRRAVATGPYKIIFRGARAPRDVGNLLIKNIEASGQFAGSGPEHLVFGRIAINARVINNTATAIEAPYLAIYTNPLNSDAHFAPVTVDSSDIGDIEIGEEGQITHLLDVAMLRSTERDERPSAKRHLQDRTPQRGTHGSCHCDARGERVGYIAKGFLGSGLDRYGDRAARTRLRRTTAIPPRRSCTRFTKRSPEKRAHGISFSTPCRIRWICVRESTDNLQPSQPRSGECQRDNRPAASMRPCNTLVRR